MHRKDSRPLRALVAQNNARSYQEYTSLDGRLFLLSVRGSIKVALRDHATGATVRCHFPDSMIDDVTAALGKRVVVEGFVRYGPRGVPASLSSITSLEILHPPLKTLEELIGSVPDFTGGVEPDEYVRSLRDDDNA